MQFIEPILEFIKTVAIIILVAFFVRFYAIQPYIVDGQSMEPNFHNGEYIMVDKLTYRFTGGPKRGDVIVFHPPQSPGVNYIKRVMAGPGETIKIKDGEITVNGAKITEPYIPQEKTLVRNSEDTDLEKTLSTDEYFVLGDNRDHSSDSREWGVLPKANIIGRAWIVVFPINNFGFVAHQSYSAVQ